jgi:hypothetical protein
MNDETTSIPGPSNVGPLNNFIRVDDEWIKCHLGPRGTQHGGGDIERVARRRG